MAKKVNVYMINHCCWIEFDQASDDNGAWVPCTMVISDKAHERVFTESEVVAILRECEYQLETLSIGKIKVGLTGVLHGRGISDPA